MVAYIALGYHRRDNEVSDEKFADSCYYLGFIFTITSIIFSLFDLPNIGTKIQDIAVRFGAAMVSTVLGLGVRVYLVSFKKDIADAIVDAEDAVMDAAAKFTEQLKVALERLRDFESQVDIAAKTSVERVNLQVENLSKNHAEKLTTFFAELTTRNQEAFTKALADIKGASIRLSNSVDGYSLGVRSNLSNIEAKVVAFTDAVTDRLRSTTFPDDYFSQQLEAPLAQVKQAAVEVSNTLRQTSAEVGDSSVVLSTAVKKLHQKTNSVDGTLDGLVQLSTQHQVVLAATQTQLNAVASLAATLTAVDGLLSNTVAGVNANNRVTSDLVSHVSLVVEEGVEARKSLEKSFAGVIESLRANHLATDSVATKLSENAASNEVLINRLTSNATASEVIATKLDSLVSVDSDSATALEGLGKQTSVLLENVEKAVGHLEGMVRALPALESALRIHGTELRHVAAEITDVKAIVEAQHGASGPAAGNSFEASAGQGATIRIPDEHTGFIGAMRHEPLKPQQEPYPGVRPASQRSVGVESGAATSSHSIPSLADSEDKLVIPVLLAGQPIKPSVPHGPVLQSSTSSLDVNKPQSPDA